MKFLLPSQNKTITNIKKDKLIFTQEIMEKNIKKKKKFTFLENVVTTNP